MHFNNLSVVVVVYLLLLDFKTLHVIFWPHKNYTICQYIQHYPGPYQGHTYVSIFY